PSEHRIADRHLEGVARGRHPAAQPDALDVGQWHEHEALAAKADHLSRDPLGVGAQCAAAGVDVTEFADADVEPFGFERHADRLAHAPLAARWRQFTQDGLVAAQVDDWHQAASTSARRASAIISRRAWGPRS